MYHSISISAEDNAYCTVLKARSFKLFKTKKKIDMRTEIHLFLDRGIIFRFSIGQSTKEK